MYELLFSVRHCCLWAPQAEKTAGQWAPQTPGKKQLEHTKSTAKSPWDSKMVRHCPIRRLMNYRAFPVDQFLLGPVDLIFWLVLTSCRWFHLILPALLHTWGLKWKSWRWTVVGFFWWWLQPLQTLVQSSVLDLIGPPKSPGIHHGSRHNETGMQHLLEGLMLNSFVM